MEVFKKPNRQWQTAASCVLGLSFPTRNQMCELQFSTLLGNSQISLPVADVFFGVGSSNRNFLSEGIKAKLSRCTFLLLHSLFFMHFYGRPNVRLHETQCRYPGQLFNPLSSRPVSKSLILWKCNDITPFCVLVTAFLKHRDIVHSNISFTSVVGYAFQNKLEINTLKWGGLSNGRK